MGRIIGIDLGTTYSVVTIPEKRDGGAFLSVRECPGVTVVLDKLKRRITPSVVAEDDDGSLVVGYKAKGRAGLSPSPIMFAKRYMGEQVTFQLGRQGTLDPRRVSTEILKYLKTMAEEQIGEPVDEAVITVPAYFSLKAKLETKAAGEAAGLRVAQVAQEPVAAALMYCAGDPRENLCIMTYDLGGGTFDVAVLRKSEGVIDTNSIVSFDGDRFLGGYNFDRKLAEWLVDRLNEQGYSIPLDETKPEVQVAFAKFMVYAERAKIALSKGETCSIQEPATGIRDARGDEVVIDLEVTRQDFEAMIGKDIDKSVELCMRAMDKADPPVRAEQIDEILMVGGSSRIPLVGKRLEEAFGRKPRLVEPDLCVALGAGLIAGTQARRVGCLSLDPVPERTDLPSIVVTGRLTPDDAVPDIAGCRVRLRAADGSVDATREVGPTGGFAFESVVLAPEATTSFTVIVLTRDGTEAARQTFSVAQSEQITGGEVSSGTNTNVLAKPILITHVSGMHTVAPERVPLPFETVIQAKTADKSGRIRVGILEENTPLGEILMQDIPETLPLGSQVEVTLTIQENFQIIGRAYVPSIAREATVVVELPVRPVKSIEELRRDYEDLRAQADDVLKTAAAAALMQGGRGLKLRERIKECDELLNARAPDAPMIQDRLDELATLIRELSAGWRPEPPREVFEEKAEETSRLVQKVSSAKPEAGKAGYDKQLTAIRAEAEKAYTAQDTPAWKESYANLIKLHDQLEAQDGGGGGGMPDPMVLVLLCSKALSELRDRARQMGREAELAGEFDAAAASLKKIDPTGPTAPLQIRDWYLSKFEPLQAKLGVTAGDGMLQIG